MAYPPAVPPNTRTNATPEVDNHPSDHNGISNALTDIINELGTNPSGTDPDLTTRLSRIEARVSLYAVGSTGIASGDVGHCWWQSLSNNDWGPGPVFTAPPNVHGVSIVQANLTAGPVVSAPNFGDVIIGVGTQLFVDHVPPGKSTITVLGVADINTGDQVSVRCYNSTPAGAFFNVSLAILQVSN